MVWGQRAEFLRRPPIPSQKQRLGARNPRLPESAESCRFVERRAAPFRWQSFPDRVRNETARSKVQLSFGLAIRRDCKIDPPGFVLHISVPCRPMLRNEPAWSRQACRRNRRYSLRIAFGAV